MAFKKNSPGCNASGGCGCGSCAIKTDDFSSDTIASAAWFVDTGTAAVSGGTLNMTTAARVISTTHHPDSTFTMTIQVDLTHNTSGKSCDVIVGSDASTGWYYARYKFGTNTIEIRWHNGGSDTQLAIKTGVTLTPGTTYTALVCVRPNGTITAALGTPGGGTPTFEVLAASTAISGTHTALATDSGNATFDNWIFTKSYNASGASTCLVCNAVNPSPASCPDCCSNSTGDTIVTFPGGLTDLNAPCTLCSGFSAGDYHLSHLGSCDWEYVGGDCQLGCTDGSPYNCGDSTRNGGRSILATTTVVSGVCHETITFRIANTSTCDAANCKLLAGATYDSPAEDPVDYCDGATRTFTLHSGSTIAGCGGAWPLTIRVRKA